MTVGHEAYLDQPVYEQFPADQVSQALAYLSDSEQRRQIAELSVAVKEELGWGRDIDGGPRLLKARQDFVDDTVRLYAKLAAGEPWTTRYVDPESVIVLGMSLRSEDPAGAVLDWIAIEENAGHRIGVDEMFGRKD